MKYKPSLTAWLIAILALVFGYPNVVNIVVAQSGSYSSACESWDKTFGGNGREDGFSVQQTSDGGYILLGSTNSYGAGKEDIWLIKTDASGNKEWDRTFGGSNSDEGRSVQQTSDGGYILLGSTNSYGAGKEDIWLIKTDASGNKEWDRTFGGSSEDGGRSVQQTSDSGYILLGSTGNTADFWLIRTDASGNKEWDRTFGGAASDYGYSVQQTSDGGYILLGVSQSYGEGRADVWLIKTDAEGKRLWDRTFGGIRWDQGNSIQQTSDGVYILFGETYSYGAGESDFWLIKTDGQGNKEWDRTFGGDNYDWGISVQHTGDGGYILLGDARSYGAGGDDFWLIKTDAQGNKQWDRTFGGSSDDYARSVQQTTDGGYILLGSTESYGAGEVDVWLIKYCPETTAEPPVGIPDENLAAGIRNALRKPPEEQIYRSDLESMEELLVPLQEIRDLTGLQYAVNLRVLDLWSNEVTDISLLIELRNLIEVDLQENPLDLSPGSKAREVVQTLLDRGVKVDY